MSDDSATISFRSVEDMIAKMTAILEATGRTVIPPQPEWKTITALAREMGIDRKNLSKALSDPCRPKSPERTGPTGRLTKVCVTPILREWLNERFTRSLTEGDC